MKRPTRPFLFLLLSLSTGLALAQDDAAAAAPSAHSMVRAAETAWGDGPPMLPAGVQVAVLYVPAMNTLFHTVPLPAATLLPLVALASLVLWAEELRKLLVRAARRHREARR